MRPRIERTIPRALKIYEKVRLPHGNDIQRRSRENGKLYEFAATDRHSHLSVTDPNDANQLVKEIGEAAMENWKWAWTTDVETEKEEAIRMLVEGLKA